MTLLRKIERAVAGIIGSRYLAVEASQSLVPSAPSVKPVSVILYDRTHSSDTGNGW